ncbi:hypothetical protein [Nannocystis radixulma]|uniref:Uncharacterized protein n=1 Tax=Nannocystis radixulma TaxID=2995305 RepID=A0ABT5B7Q8_9BACT|nr:hypothetical protein [Nannocystis radixulma]MDC0669569.1 hypothetical protein [Nannocystis radixulma]
MFQRLPFDPVFEVVTRILGAAPVSLSPDAMIGASIGRVEGAAYKVFASFLKYDDAEIAERTGLHHVGFSGELFVVTEASYTRDSKTAVAVDAGDLASFVEGHRKIFNDPFFHGDVVIVERDGRKIWTFDHEGGYGLLCD